MEWQNPSLYVSLLLFVLGGGNEARAVPEAGFLGKNSVEARRVLHEYVEKQAKTVIWARHLSALVFLERLTGNEAEARAIWAKCDLNCRKLLPSDERDALQRWGK